MFKRAGQWMLTKVGGCMCWAAAGLLCPVMYVCYCTASTGTLTRMCVLLLRTALMHGGVFALHCTACSLLTKSARPSCVGPNRSLPVPPSLFTSPDGPPERRPVLRLPALQPQTLPC